MNLIRRLFGTKKHTEDLATTEKVVEQYHNEHERKDAHLSYHPPALSTSSAETDIKELYNVQINDSLIVPDIVLLWWYSVVKDTRTRPGYFEYRYGINDDKRTAHLINTGYIDYADTLTYLKQLKNDDLKSILRNHGLKVGGKKAELLERIMNEIPTTELDMIIDKDSYRPTEKGYEALKQFKHIVYGHEHFDGTVTPLTMYQQYEYMHGITGNYHTPGDVSWAIYGINEQQETLKYVKNETTNYGAIRNASLNFYKQLRREGRNEHALLRLLAIMIYDVCLDDVPFVADRLYDDLKELVTLEQIEAETIDVYVEDAKRFVFSSHKLKDSDMELFYDLLNAKLSNDEERFEAIKRGIK